MLRLTLALLVCAAAVTSSTAAANDKKISRTTFKENKQEFQYRSSYLPNRTPFPKLPPAITPRGTTRINGQLVSNTTIRYGENGAPLGYQFIKRAGQSNREVMILVPATPFFNRRQWDRPLSLLHQRLNGPKGRGMPIVLFDYPGAGLSLGARIPRARESLMTLVNQVTALIDHLHLHEHVEKVHLFGYSLGACNSIGAAVNRPHLVASIQTYGLPLPEGKLARAFEDENQATQKRFKKYFGGMPPSTIVTPDMVHNIVKVLIGPKKDRNNQFYHVRTRVISLFAGKSLVGTELRSLKEFIKRYTEERFFGKDVAQFKEMLFRLRRLDIPVRFGVGLEDDTAPPCMTEAAQEIVGRGEVKKYDGLDHLSFGFKKRHAKKVVDDYLRWLDQVSPK